MVVILVTDASGTGYLRWRAAAIGAGEDGGGSCRGVAQSCVMLWLFAVIIVGIVAAIVYSRVYVCIVHSCVLCIVVYCALCNCCGYCDYCDCCDYHYYDYGGYL